MPIFLEPKIIFIHVPKCGGTTVEHVFGMNTVSHFFSKRIVPEIHKNKTPQHLTWEELYEILPIEFLKRMPFKFAFVRNPFSRFISEYCWVKKHNKWIVTLDDLVQSLSHAKDSREYDFDGHLETQSSFLYGAPKEMFIGRFETFECDLRSIAGLLDIPLSTVPKLNTSEHSENYRDYYTPRMRRVVENFYREDLENYGYYW